MSRFVEAAEVAFGHERGEYWWSVEITDQDTFDEANQFFREGYDVQFAESAEVSAYFLLLAGEAVGAE